MIKQALASKYKKYAVALKAGNLCGASYFASEYNFLLACAGGPDAVKGEFYLSMGRTYVTKTKAV